MEKALFMRFNMPFMRRAIALCTLALCVSCCTTLEYRSIDQQFEDVVQADNVRSVSPFTDPDAPDASYQQVATRLTPQYIAGLEEALRPNAWMLRSIATWRAGELNNALSSSAAGLAAPALKPHSRDHIILLMIPTLVIDSDLKQKWDPAGQSIAPTNYGAYEKDFQTALAKLKEAEAAIGESTPTSAVYYLHYQRWRILQNWRKVIRSIQADTPQPRIDAGMKAKAFLGGKELKEAAEAERDAIQADHPLRALIRVQGGG